MENTHSVPTNSSYPAFPLAFEQVALGIAYADLAGRWLDMNKVVCTITGYSREELQHKTVEEITYPADREIDRIHLQRILKQEITSYTQKTRYIRCDGTILWIHLTVALVCDYDERPWYIAITIEDIHAHMQEEKEQWQLLTKEANVRSQSERQNEQLHVLQAITDTALMHLKLDTFFQAILGRIRAIMNADNITILLLDEEDHVLKVRAVEGMEEAVASEVRVPIGQGFAGSIAAQCKPLIVQENTPIVVLTPLLREEMRSLLGVPLMAQGKVIGVIHIGMKYHRDFTEEDAQLFQRVADRLALEIERTMLYEQAQSARQEALSHAQHLTAINQFLRDFIAIASHEFRTALTSIQGFSSILCSEDIDIDEARSFGCDIYTDSQRLTRLINDILDLERMREGKSDLQPELLDIVSLLQEEIHNAEATSTKHIFRLFGESTLPKLQADQDKLHRAISNLLSNAIKYSPQGGVIEVSCRREQDYLHLSIHDHGIGIPQEAISKLFTPYTRIASDKTRYIQGTGLGLSIVHHIVEIHQGKVWAESVPDQGSTFHVLLPFMQSSS